MNRIFASQFHFVHPRKYLEHKQILNSNRMHRI